MTDQPGVAPTANSASSLTPALAVAVLALVVAALGPAGTQVGLWSYDIGRGIFLAAPWIALVAGILALVGAARGGRLWRALGVMILAAAAAALPVRTWLAGRGAPPIHDVTTDPEHPPQYVAIAKLRTAGTNAAAYGGDAVSRLQREAYPDLRPLVVQAPPERALALAADTARAQGWTVVAQDLGFGSFGRLEATETTLLFGRVDDVVVRIVPHEVGSRIDVRSSSRADAVDAGRNAQRIRRFLAFLAERARAEIPRNG